MATRIMLLDGFSGSHGKIRGMLTTGNETLLLF